jgi:hypothetical protein
MQPLSALHSFLFDTKAEKVVRQLKATINLPDSTVRNFAVRESTRYFNEAYPSYGQLVRQLSLFKSINQRFRYVPDPVSSEYYASAEETIENGLAGDCDDYTILMIAALQAIGARVRLVLIKEHVYPELYGGDEQAFLQVKKAITAQTAIKIIARLTAAKPPNGRTIAPQTPPSSAVNAKVRKPAARSPSASPRACQPRSRPISRPIANATDNRQINASTLNSYICANLLKAYRTRNLKMTHFQKYHSEASY